MLMKVKKNAPQVLNQTEHANGHFVGGHALACTMHQITFNAFQALHVYDAMVFTRHVGNGDKPKCLSATDQSVTVINGCAFSDTWLMATRAAQHTHAAVDCADKSTRVQTRQTQTTLIAEFEEWSCWKSTLSGK